MAAQSEQAERSMTREQEKSQAALTSRIAASLIYDARLKDFEAACWLGLPNNIAEAAANVHSASEAVLDATAKQIRAVKEQQGSGA
jgi:hypothetical protein